MKVGKKETWSHYRTMHSRKSRDHPWFIHWIYDGGLGEGNILLYYIKADLPETKEAYIKERHPLKWLYRCFAYVPRVQVL